MANFLSDNVLTAFPAARRSEETKHLKDKLMSEVSIARIIKILSKDTTGNFIYDYELSDPARQDSSIKIIKFCVAGYYFEVDVTNENTQQANKHLYISIDQESGTSAYDWLKELKGDKEGLFEGLVYRAENEPVDLDAKTWLYVGKFPLTATSLNTKAMLSSNAFAIVCGSLGGAGKQPASTGVDTIMSQPFWICTDNGQEVLMYYTGSEYKPLGAVYK